MCEEESDDAEAVNKLLEINDSIHRTIERYKLIKQGDIDAASKIPKGTLGTSTGVSKNADNELSLIDFGGDEPSPGPSIGTNGGNASKTDSLEDDLLGLSMQDNAYGQSGGIALGFGANTSKSLHIIGIVNWTRSRRTWSFITIFFDAAKYSTSTVTESYSPTSTRPRACQTKLRPILSNLKFTHLISSNNPWTHFAITTIRTAIKTSRSIRFLIFAACTTLSIP